MEKEIPKFFDQSSAQIEYCVFNELPSTHKFALDQNWFHRMDPNHFMVIFAEKQTLGQGSHGRNWVSAPNDFHINLVFLTNQIYPFTQLTALTVCQHLSQVTNKKFPFYLKWPNDVYVQNKKISGCISHIRRWNELYWVTIGLGINYNLDLVYVRTLDQPATSLKLLQKSSRDYEVADIFESVQRFAERFVKNLCWYQQIGWRQFYNDCQPIWLYLNEEVSVFDEDKKQWIKGIFEAISKEGALLIRLQNQSLYRVLNGTQLHRPTHKLMNS